MQQRIGFIGVGVMGRPMTLNLLKAGYPVTVFARSPEKIQDVIAAGARLAKSSAEVGQQSEIVITMLPNTPDVEAVVLGPGGVLEGMPSGGVIIDMSTIAPAGSQRITETCRAQGVDFLDAPVSGGTVGAKNGTLTIMAGGDKAAFERVRPVLEAMGNPENIIHVGPSGAGEIVKLVNNVMAANIAAACAEALVLGVKAGADLATMVRIISASTGANMQLSNVFPARVFNGSFELGFATNLMTKDVGLALELARDLDVPMPVSECVIDLFENARGLGFGEIDYTSIIKVLEDQAGVKVRS